MARFGDRCTQASSGQRCTARLRRSSKQAQRQATHNNPQHRIPTQEGRGRQGRQCQRPLPRGPATRNMGCLLVPRHLLHPPPRLMPTPTQKQHARIPIEPSIVTISQAPHSKESSHEPLETAACRSQQHEANPQAARQARTASSAAVHHRHHQATLFQQVPCA